jgi:hypothetical protein
MKKNSFYIQFPQRPRAGCRDIWNAHLLENATFDKCDIPFCPTTALDIPQKLISLKDAKALYESEKRKGNRSFKCDAFIHPYVDDPVFDGSKEGYWIKPNQLLELAKHFDGMITIDFSTNLDFPDPQKRWNTYRSRSLGIYASNNGIPTINNVRWGEEETWAYSFSGLPRNSIYAIGSLASGINQPGYKEIFTNGLRYMVNKLDPKALIIVGSDNLPIFEELRKKGINIVVFKSDTAEYYERRKEQNEQKS